MELVRVGIGRLDDKVRAVSFRLFLADSRQRVGTLPFGCLFSFRVAEPKATLDSLLPLVAATLDFLKVTGEVVLRSVAHATAPIRRTVRRCIVVIGV